MAREFGTLAHYWDGSFEQVKGFYTSRKFNGFSVIWDGGVTRGMLASDVPWYYKGKDDDDLVATGLWTLGRGNKPKVIVAPRNFLDKLPIDVPLHGELWKDDDLQYIKKTVRLKVPKPSLWRPIKLKVFSVKPYELFNMYDTEIDLPNFMFPKRLLVGYLLELAKSLYKKQLLEGRIKGGVVEFVEFTKMNSRQQLTNLLLDFNNTTNEGIMFADLKQPYECKRSWNILKYKPIYEDECKILSYEMGKTGKNIGKVASIKVEFTIDEKCLSIHGGQREFIGRTVNFLINVSSDDTNDEIREMFPIGKVINFEFNLYSQNGYPQHTKVYKGR